MSMGPHWCYELAITRLPDYLPILHHGFSSQYCTYGHAFNFLAMVRRPADFRVSGFVADDCFLIHVDDYYISVGAWLDDAFSRVHTEDTSGIVRHNANQGIQR